LTAALVAAIWMLPWLAKNWLYFANPFMPFLNAWFPNPYLLPSAEAAWVEKLRRFNGAEFNLHYPWEATIRGVTTMGFTGPFFLLLPVAVLSLRQRAGRWMMAAAAVTSLPWLFGNPIVRFAIPTLPLLAMGICLGLDRRRWGALAVGACVLVQAGMCFPLLIGKWNKQWVIALKEIPWRRAFRLEKPEEYWRKKLASYTVLEYVESELEPGARILAFDEQYQFFTTRLLGNPYSSEQSSSAAEMIGRAVDPGGWPRQRCRARLPGVPARRVRLQQLESERHHGWTVFEAWLDGAVAGRLRAEPNPWEAAWTTDGERWDRVELAAECEAVPAQGFARQAMCEVRRRGWTHVMARRGWEWLERMLPEPERHGVRVAYSTREMVLLEACPQGAGGPKTAPRAHRLDESPAGYCLAGCSPAEPASASPAESSMMSVEQPGKRKSANGKLSLISVSQPRGALEVVPIFRVSLLGCTPQATRITGPWLAGQTVGRSFCRGPSTCTALLMRCVHPSTGRRKIASGFAFLGGQLGIQMQSVGGQRREILWAYEECRVA